MIEFYRMFWTTLDRMPLRLKTMAVCVYTAIVAGAILFVLVAATVAPQDFDFWQKCTWLGSQIIGTGFGPLAITLGALALGVQAWANARASSRFYAVRQRMREGETPEPEAICRALDELAVYPLKASGVSLVLWIVQAVLWWVSLDAMEVLPRYISLFISAGIFFEGFIATPYQYHVFKLQTERDYLHLERRLDEPYFPERARFVTITKKLGGSITILLFFSLLALGASNLLLAWQGVQTQTTQVGRSLLETTSLSIANLRDKVEAQSQFSQQIYGAQDFLYGGAPDLDTRDTSEILLERVGKQLDDLGERVGQYFFLLDPDGDVRHRAVPGKVSEAGVRETMEEADAVLGDVRDRIRAQESTRFIKEESVETQGLFLALPIEWPGGQSWYLGTFYTGEELRSSVWGITKVSAGLIAVMIVVGLIIAFLIAYDASRSLNHMTSRAVRVSEGDLSETSLILVSEDEVGVLARALSSMFRSYHRTLQSIETTAQSLDSATTEIEQVSKKVADGAEIQVSSSKETNENMSVLLASIKSIGENVEVLASSAEESSSSIFEMGSTIEEVASSVSQLFDAIDDSTSVVTQMVASIRQVAESAQELSGITSDTALSIDDMAQAIRLVEQDAADTRDISERTASDAQAGALSVQQTIEGIQEIRKSVQAASGVIETLNESTNSIGNILNYIRDVADQTNLLSLNAGIIAAQAGEHGKGFAVIAKEVSTLAERTGRYTREIERLIAEVQTNAKDAIIAMEAGTTSVNAGVELSTRAGEALQKILASAQQASERISSIANTAADQSQSAQKVARAIGGLTNMAQQIAKATEEQNRGSEQILNTAERMRNVAAVVKKTTQEQSRSSKQITQAIENINDMVRYINDSQREEVVTCERVVGLVRNINQVTLQNFDNVMNLERAIEVLRRQSGSLKDQLDRFELDGRKNGSTPVEPGKQPAKTSGTSKPGKDSASKTSPESPAAKA